MFNGKLGQWTGKPYAIGLKSGVTLYHTRPFALWVCRSETLALLTSLTSKDVKWKWTDVHQKAFATMKKIVARKVLLHYPNFNDVFEIHPDASATQLGAVISQKGKPISFYNRKLNPAQTRYITTKRKLLAVVETLKEFKNILLGQQLRVYTDHKKLTYKSFNTCLRSLVPS